MELNNSSIQLRLSIRSAFFATLLALVCLPSALFADDAETILVVVNSDTISSSDVDSEFMKTHRQQSATDKASFDAQKVLNKLVNDLLIVQEAKGMGMDSEVGFISELEQIRQLYATRYFIKDSFKPDLNIEDSEIEKNFKKYYWKIKLRTVAVASLDEANDLRAAIMNGAAMDSIAKDVSLDSKKFMGGAHGSKFWADVPQILRNQAFDLEVGQLSEPFPYEEAFMILRVEKKDEADFAALSMFERTIRTNLRNDLKVATWNSFVDSLKEIYPITVAPSEVESIKADSALLFRADFLRGTAITALSAIGVNPVTNEELRKEISHAAMNAGDKTFDEICSLALTNLVEKLALCASANSNGYLEIDQVVRKIEVVRDSMLIESYLGENVADRMTFSHQEFQSYYDAHLDDYRLPDKVQLKAMQFETEEVAREAYANLSGGADFDFVARRLARTGGVENDENRWYTIDSYPDKVAKDLKNARVGQCTSPYQLARGWVLFKLKARDPGKVQTLDEVDMKIREVMFQQKFAEVLDDLLEQLKQGSDIEYKDDAIEAYFGDNI